MLKFKAKLKIIWAIITGKYKYCFIITLDESNFKKLKKQYPYDASLDYFGLRKYQVSRIIKDISDTKDDIELALDKAQFEADYLESKK